MKKFDLKTTEKEIFRPRESLNVKLYQTFKEFTQFLCNIFHKTQEEEIIPNSFYDSSITLIPKLDKVSKKRNLWANKSHEYRQKNL